MNFIHLVSLGQYLASQGFICLRFTCKGLNLGYRVKAYRAVWVHVNTDSFPGRSMGCRAAVDDALVQGVICLSFPLHPPGQTHKHTQRTEDLRMLSERVHGSKNLKNVLKKKPWCCLINHGLTVKGRSESSVLEEVNLKKSFFPPNVAYIDLLCHL
uniref:Testis expressed 30 n=1 Tax=Gouania willdenowi TaxID=441366 RepID=A0A8C5HSW9_GOUWI